MGFATGFTGGVTLTLSFAYLSVLTHQRVREAQSASIRAQTLVLQHLLDPLPQPLPLTRAEVAAQHREASVTVAKNKWNAEVENAVRWVQHTDWDEVRDSLESRLAYMWAKATGQSAEEIEKARRTLEPTVKRARANIEETGGEIVSAAKGAFKQAKGTAEKYEMTAENRALDARLKSRKAIEDVGAEAKTVAAGVLERGREKAKEIVGNVRSAVGLAEVQVEEMTGSKVTAPSSNPVQQALDQRYEKPRQDTRTVAEILKDRYVPIDQRESSNLKGL